MFFLNMRIFAVVLHIITTVSAFAEQSETIVTEGAEALLTFRHTSESSVPYSIGIGQRDPFCKDGQLILDNLTPSQQKRFRVQAWHSRTQQYTLVQIVIKEVQRTDGGSYTCTFYKNVTDSPRSKEIALTVNFPPGKAHCWSMPTETKRWDEIQCAAKGGSPPGAVVCRAFNKKEVPVRQTPSQNATHILNRFLVNHDTSMYCCSKNDVNLNDLTCADFVLERGRPLYDGTSSAAPLGEKVTDINISIEVPITTESNIQNSRASNLNILIAIIIPISTVIIVIVVLCIVHRSKGQTKQKTVYSTVTQDLPEIIPNEGRISRLDSQPVESAHRDDDENKEQSTQDSMKNGSEEKEEVCCQETKETFETQTVQTSIVSPKLPETQAYINR